MEKTDTKTRFENINLYEAYCLALTIDEERKEFYENLAGKIKNTRVKNELLFLRDEEEKRAAYFEERIEDFEEDKEVLGACDPEKKLYIWVENEIIKPFQEGRNLKPLDNGTKALLLGRELQEKTISFYQELINHEKDPHQRAELADILDQEKKYRNKLNIIISY